MTLEEKIDKALRSGADTISRWLQTPGGRGSFDKAVAEHLLWFQAARLRGMGWSAIVNVLSHAGVKRDSGLRLSEGHVRGVVSRQQKRVKIDQNAVLERLVERYGSTPAETDGGSRPQLKHAPSKALAFGLNVALQAPPSKKRSEPSGKVRHTRMDGQSGMKTLSPKASLDRGDIRAFMQKAATLRRRSDKD
jgi:hypothetical protein